MSGTQTKANAHRLSNAYENMNRCRRNTQKTERTWSAEDSIMEHAQSKSTSNLPSLKGRPSEGITVSMRFLSKEQDERGLYTPNKTYELENANKNYLAQMHRGSAAPTEKPTAVPESKQNLLTKRTTIDPEPLRSNSPRRTPKTTVHTTNSLKAPHTTP